jgi:hypothetical protein
MTDLRTQAGIDAANDAPFYQGRYKKIWQSYFRTEQAAKKWREKNGGLATFEIPSGAGPMWRVDQIWDSGQ